jgi:hypothetical protein
LNITSKHFLEMRINSYAYKHFHKTQSAGDIRHTHTEYIRLDSIRILKWNGNVFWKIYSHAS